MKRFLIAIALTCALSSSTLAGEIPTDGAPSPAPNPTPASSRSPGIIPSDGLAEQISGGALSALLSVLSLLA